MNNQLLPDNKLNQTSQPVGLPMIVDANWLESRFISLAERIAAMESALEVLEQSIAEVHLADAANLRREYYSPEEFAELVGRSTYTVQGWAREGRIEAEKCDSGRGNSKHWKIPAQELQRYFDHGLLEVAW